MKKVKLLAHKLTHLDYNMVLDYIDLGLGYIEEFLITFFFASIVFFGFLIYVFFFY